MEHTKDDKRFVCEACGSKSENEAGVCCGGERKKVCGDNCEHAEETQSEEGTVN